jgi:predicted Zn finger-like uncharacterized protein
MILTCPNCDAKFNIKDGALGTEGRKVKCSKCDHRWHAMPDGDDAAPPPPAPEPKPAAAPEPEAVASAAPDLDDPGRPGPEDPFADLDKDPGGPAPESEAMPEPGPGQDDDAPPPSDMLAGDLAPAEAAQTSEIDEPMPTIPPDSAFEPREPEPRKSGLLGWIIFFVVIAAIIGGMIVFRGALVSLYPPLSKVYELVGIGPALPGEGLKLPTPQRSVRKDGDTTVLDISGTIENTTSKPIDLPTLKGILYDSKKNETYHWFFKATQPTILPGEKIPYKTEVKNPPTGSVQLVITFSADGK